MFYDRFFLLMEWWKLHARLGEKKTCPLFKEGEIWWCSIGLNIGVEIFGKGIDFARPVVVFKKFDANSFLGIPMTTQRKDGSWYVPMAFGGQEQKAILSQAKTLDAVRLLRKVGTLNDTDLNDLYSRFKEFFTPETYSPHIGGDARRGG